jgi:hypothetical protein
VTGPVNVASRAHSIISIGDGGQVRSWVRADDSVFTGSKANTVRLNPLFFFPSFELWRRSWRIPRFAGLFTMEEIGLSRRQVTVLNWTNSNCCRSYICSRKPFRRSCFTRRLSQAGSNLRVNDLTYPMRCMSGLKRDNVREHPRQTWMPSDKDIIPHS